MLHNAPLPLNQVGDIPVRLDLSMIDNMFVKKDFSLIRYNGEEWLVYYNSFLALSRVYQRMSFFCG